MSKVILCHLPVALNMLGTNQQHQKQQKPTKQTDIVKELNLETIENNTS